MLMLSADLSMMNVGMLMRVDVLVSVDILMMRVDVLVSVDILMCVGHVDGG